MVFTGLGDLGQTIQSNYTLDHLKAVGAQAIIHAGDLSYADCNPAGWDSYLGIIQGVASGIPYMVSPGNHEIEYDQTAGVAFNAFKHRFRMPEVAPESDTTSPSVLNSAGCTSSGWTGEYNYGNSFYSFDMGLTHVIMLNAYSNTSEGSPQHTWLLQDFSSIDRSKTPFVVAAWHGPWYNSNSAHRNEGNIVAMQASLETLFYENKVNLVMTGHVHAYERTHPVYKSVVTPGAPVYMNVGSGANSEGAQSSWDQNISDWSAFRDGLSSGHAVIRVVNATYVAVEWHRLGVSGTVITWDIPDSFTIELNYKISSTPVTTKHSSAASIEICSALLVAMISLFHLMI